MRRGAEAANMIATSSAAADEAEKITFSQLKILQQVYRAKAEYVLPSAVGCDILESLTIHAVVLYFVNKV